MYWMKDPQNKNFKVTLKIYDECTIRDGFNIF